MLRPGLSLKVRAALIFLPIYLAVFLAGLLMVSSASLSVEEDHHVAPNIAIAFAADALERTGGRLRLPRPGAFAELAEDNPALWLLLEDRGRLYAFGNVPPAAVPLVRRLAGPLEAASFHVPGVPRPLSDAAVALRDTGAGPVLIAAGGVDSRNVSLAHALRYFLDQGLFVLFLFLAALGFVAMLVALPVLARALKPVAADAAAIRPDRPAARLRETSVPRELLPLVRGFNAALDRLAGELVRRKRFIADLAHELRTPLTILSLQVDGLDEAPAKRELGRTVARLTDMVAQMLDLERLSLAVPPNDEIDLSDLAREAVADLAPMALAAGYELSLSARPAPVPVRGDRHALGRAVANLISNAVAHGGGSGQIEVTVGEGRTLDVTDEGPGIAAAVRPHLFEPFSRHAWDRDGCGLGLHLTREIMRAHGGDALLLDSRRGAAFRLRFAPG